MLNKKRVCVVMPAYRAEMTLEKTWAEIPRDIVDDIILVDDNSPDGTVRLAKKLKIHTIVHPKNRGYGGNQKTCYQAALSRKADIVIMLHPDYQYSPKLLTAMAAMLAYDEYDVVLASRFIGESPLRGGMPLYKFVFNRMLTKTQNLLMWQRISEYHTGYRAFTRQVLEALPLETNSDDFVFDNEMLGQICKARFRIGEIACPTKYFDEASSINFIRSSKYGLGVLGVSLKYFFSRLGFRFRIFKGIRQVR